MGRTALIVQGGWDGHQPKEVAELFAGMLRREGFSVEVSDTLDSFRDVERLRNVDLIVPVWTMSAISREQVEPVIEAVADGTGIAGCHGGMCDAFRSEVRWQFMTGGNWVAHPGGTSVRYRVHLVRGSSPLVQDLPDFDVETEQYYLHVDPAVEVLATTRFPTVTYYHAANGPVDMPVVWTKRWGVGRVFYCSLGHHAEVLRRDPTAEIVRRGFLWAAEGKRLARERGLDASAFRGAANP